VSFMVGIRLSVQCYLSGMALRSIRNGRLAGGFNPERWDGDFPLYTKLGLLPTSGSPRKGVSSKHCVLG